MQAFLTFAGFVGCTIMVAITVIKAIEAVWFFKEFRDNANRTLERIEQALRKHKP